MILVTGGTGMVGAHILLQLVNNGHSPVAIKRPDSSLDYVRRIFQYYGNHNFSHIQWRDADINDLCSLEEAFKGIEKVIHAAALVSFNPADDARLIRTNQYGTANLVNLCLENRIKKLLYISSVASLGTEEGEKFINEETAWKESDRKSTYSVSKYNAECEVWRGIEEGLNAVILNPAIILGPAEAGKSSGALVNACRKGSKFYTGGASGFIDVRDVAYLSNKLLDSDINKQRFVLSAQNLSYRNVLNLFSEVLNKPKPVMRAPRLLLSIAALAELLRSKISGNTPALTRYTLRSAFERNAYDNSKIKNTLNYSFIEIDEAIKNAVRF